MTRLATVAAAVAALAAPASAFHPHGGTTYTYRVHGHGAPPVAAVPQTFSFAAPVPSFAVAPQAFSFGVAPTTQAFSFGVVPTQAFSFGVPAAGAFGFFPAGGDGSGASAFGLNQATLPGRGAAANGLADTLTPAVLAALKAAFPNLFPGTPAGGVGAVDLSGVNAKLDAILVLQAQLLARQAESDKKLDAALDLLNKIKAKTDKLP